MKKIYLFTNLIIICAAHSSWAVVNGVTDSGKLIVSKSKTLGDGYWLYDVTKPQAPTSLGISIAEFPKYRGVESLTVSRDEKLVTAIGEYQNDQYVTYKLYQKNLESGAVKILADDDSYSFVTNATSNRVIFESEHYLLGDYPKTWLLSDSDPRPKGCSYSYSRSDGYCLYNTSLNKNWATTRIEANPELKDTLNSNIAPGVIQISESGKYALTHGDRAEQIYITDLNTMSSIFLFDGSGNSGYDVWSSKTVGGEKNFFVTVNGKEFLVMRVFGDAEYVVFDPATGAKVPFANLFPLVAKWNYVDPANSNLSKFSLSEIFMDDNGHPRSRMYHPETTAYVTIDWLTGESRTDYDTNFETSDHIQMTGIYTQRSIGGKYTVLFAKPKDQSSNGNSGYYIKKSDSPDYVYVSTDLTTSP